MSDRFFNSFRWHGRADREERDRDQEDQDDDHDDRDRDDRDDRDDHHDREDHDDREDRDRDRDHDDDDDDDDDHHHRHGIVCFEAQTRIMTPDGPRAVADLQAGDAVRTLDHGAARLIWTGQQRVQGTGPNAPVRFATGAIGNHAPLLLSQQHRVLMRTPLAELLFGHPEVLIPARALVDGGDVRLTPAAHITYVHILLARHEVLWAEGAECESLLLGEETQRVLDDPARDEMHRLMPGASRPPSGAVHSRAARPILRMGEARRLIAARARASPATRHLVRAGS